MEVFMLKKFVLFSGIVVSLLLIFAIREPLAIKTLQRLNYEGQKAAKDTYKSEGTKSNLPAPRGAIYNSEGEKIPALRSEIFNSVDTIITPRADTSNSEGAKGS